MSEEYQRIELITGKARRRHRSTQKKLRIIEESFEPGEMVSLVTGVTASRRTSSIRWRRLMSEGGMTAVGSDEDVVGNSEVRKLGDRVREMERLVGRKTVEVEILREALSKASQKIDLAAALVAEGRFPMKRVVEALGVARTNMVESSCGKAYRRGPTSKPITRRCCRSSVASSTSGRPMAIAVSPPC